MPKPNTKNTKRLDAKLAHITEQLNDLHRNERIVLRVGGRDYQGPLEEVAFQEARLEVAAWCQSATADQIAERLDGVKRDLGNDGVAAMGGNVRGLSDATVAKIAEAEILALALGA